MFDTEIKHTLFRIPTNKPTDRDNNQTLNEYKQNDYIRALMQAPSTQNLLQ